MQISLLYISNSIWAHWLKYYFSHFWKIMMWKWQKLGEIECENRFLDKKKLEKLIKTGNSWTKVCVSIFRPRANALLSLSLPSFSVTGARSDETGSCSLIPKNELHASWHHVSVILQGGQVIKKQSHTTVAPSEKRFYINTFHVVLQLLLFFKIGA